MSDTQSSGVHESVSELGFTLDSQEESSSSEAVTESTDAEGEANNEEVTEPVEGEGNQEAALEEDAQAATEVVKEEPKLTLKEFQEIQAAQTQLENERKAFMEEKARMETEFQQKYHEKLQVHDQFDDFYAHLADKDPELFGIIKAEFQEHQKQYSNPVLNKLKAENAEIKQKLDSFLNKTSDQVALNGLEVEMQKFNASIGKEAEAAGLKIDRKVIEDMWAKGLTVNEAFYAKYGEAFAKASASKAKVAAVTKKVESKPVVNTAGNVSRTNAKADSGISGMNAFDSIKAIAKQVTGKSF